MPSCSCSCSCSCFCSCSCCSSYSSYSLSCRRKDTSVFSPSLSSSAASRRLLFSSSSTTGWYLAPLPPLPLLPLLCPPPRGGDITPFHPPTSIGPRLSQPSLRRRAGTADSSPSSREAPTLSLSGEKPSMSGRLLTLLSLGDTWLRAAAMLSLVAHLRVYIYNDYHYHLHLHWHLPRQGEHPQAWPG